ncbi:MAG: hypothetical protein NTX65_00095 [Ignavibacteriales bacterium]|nr:hypothetical protein [Ignavibacteriales bacterium]
MKKITILIAVFSLLLILNTGCGTMMYSVSNYDEPRNSFSELDIYGQWINVPELGNVWRPNVGNDWSPYDNGQWELTDRGWMWFSDEPYGWIVYHYGSWAFTDFDGWVWSPGYEWSPSRVNWITQDDYIGWAPIPPNGWNLPTAYDNNGSRVWRIVHTKDFDNREINKYRVSNSTLKNRRDWKMNNSPNPDNIRHATGRNIAPVNTQTENVRGGKRDLTRVKIIERNHQNDTPTKPRDNQINVPPPSVEKNYPQQPVPPSNRSNDGERNRNNPPQNVPPTKSKDDKVEPKHQDEKPILNPNEQERKPVDRKKVVIPESRPPVIINNDAVRTKTRVILKEDTVRTTRPVMINDEARKIKEPVIKTEKKQIEKNDLKKQKQDENKLNRRDDKKIIREGKEKKTDESEKK